MNEWIRWFQEVLDVAIRLYFRQDCPRTSIYDIPPPSDNQVWKHLLPSGYTPAFDEQVVLMLALMPHLSPQVLDIFFVMNKNFDRPYTEFGGWKGLSHSGFLPTGETASFLLAGDKVEKRMEVVRMFRKEHWFHTGNLLHLEGTGEGEPFLSGQLRVSDDLLYSLSSEGSYKPDYSMGFPAKRITSPLDWEDVVLPYDVMEEVEEINTWIAGHPTIMSDWGLSRFLKAGYRTLFYGPPGTGKTLMATLIGKKNQMDVYRVDLSMIVSKYIGETEKNLAKVFDRAENRNWILFFDEADALFGKRTSTNTSNDRHANQEVAYLLQRIEDFPGTVVLATNLRSNIDEAFSRRFQSIIYFPMPDADLREALWRKMLPAGWLPDEGDKLIRKAASFELSGGSISNVIRRCALQLLYRSESRLTSELLTSAIRKEQHKEGKW